jgi:hypothetical protein
MVYAPGVVTFACTTTVFAAVTTEPTPYSPFTVATVQAPGAPDNVYAAGPITLTLNVQLEAPNNGVNAFAPPTVGVPLPVSITSCGPVELNTPVFENVIPPTVFVARVNVPGDVTFTLTVAVLAAVNTVPTR